MLPYHSPSYSPVPLVRSSGADLKYLHGDISFESPPGSPEPYITILPDQEGLEIRSTLRTTTRPNELDDLEAGDPRFPVRSTSSSYPSEGIRSPTLSASPPMTFGRRVLSSLEAYGFSSAHLPFLQSTDSSTQGFQSGNGTQVASEEMPRTEPADNHIWDFLAGKRDGNKNIRDAEEPANGGSHHEREMTEIEPAGANPGHKSVIDLGRSLSTNNKNKANNEASSLKHSNTYPRRRKEPRSPAMSMMTTRIQSSADVPNLSTICLPCASDGLEKTRPASVDESLPQVDHCSQVSTHSDSLDERGSYLKRSESTKRCSFRNRLSHYFQLRQTVKVKKWIVGKLRAGRQGSRVVVRKAKERKAKIVGVGSCNGGRNRKALSINKPRAKGTSLFHGGGFMKIRREQGVSTTRFGR